MSLTEFGCIVGGFAIGLIVGFLLGRWATNE